MRRNRRVALVGSLLFVAMAVGASRAQIAIAGLRFKPLANARNVRYGSHERQVLDFWKTPIPSPRPTPLVVYIHGGGFRQGSKANMPTGLLRRCLAAGFSVASINYRYSQQAPYPAPMLDGARAVQFARTQAEAWNIDPDRIAVVGDSAGGGIALWVAFHDDLADPAGPGPVCRSSSRVAAVAGIGAQSSYDINYIREHIGGRAHEHPALLKLYGLTQDEAEAPFARLLYEHASPINLVSPGDPPAFLYYSEPDAPIPPNAKPGEGIHHPRFGELLQESLQSCEIPCVRRHEREYRALPEPQEAMFDDMVGFFRQAFDATPPHAPSHSGTSSGVDH